MSAPISSLDQKKEIYSLMRSYAYGVGLASDELTVARAVWFNRAPEKTFKVRQKKWAQTLATLHQEKLALAEFQGKPIDETCARLFLLRLLAHLRVLVRVWRRDRTHATEISIMELLQQYDYLWLWKRSFEKATFWKTFARLWAYITEELFIPLAQYDRLRGAFAVSLLGSANTEECRNALLRFFRSNGMVARIQKEKVRTRGFRIHNRAIRRILTMLQVCWPEKVQVTWSDFTRPDTPWQFPYSAKTYNHAMLEFHRLRFLDSPDTFNPQKGLRRLRELSVAFASENLMKT